MGEKLPLCVSTWCPQPSTQNSLPRHVMSNFIAKGLRINNTVTSRLWHAELKTSKNWITVLKIWVDMASSPIHRNGKLTTDSFSYYQMVLLVIFAVLDNDNCSSTLPIVYLQVSRRMSIPAGNLQFFEPLLGEWYRTTRLIYTYRF